MIAAKRVFGKCSKKEQKLVGRGVKPFICILKLVHFGPDYIGPSGFSFEKSVNYPFAYARNIMISYHLGLSYAG